MCIILSILVVMMQNIKLYEFSRTKHIFALFETRWKRVLNIIMYIYSMSIPFVKIWQAPM